MTDAVSDQFLAQYFTSRSAHSDVAQAWRDALAPLGEFEVHGGGARFGGVYAQTGGTLFAGATGMDETYWRLRPGDRDIALASGATPAPFGPEWVCISLFRSDWPAPDLRFWALRAYDFARIGR